MNLRDLKIFLHTQVRRATFGQVWFDDPEIKVKPNEVDEAIRLLKEASRLIREAVR